MIRHRWGYRVPGRGWRPCRCPGTGNRSPVVPADLRPWDQATGPPAYLKAVPGSLLPASFRTSLFLVMIRQHWGYLPQSGPVLPALPLPWHGEPGSRCPCWPPAMNQTTMTTGLPEGRSRLPAVRQLLNAAIPGDVPQPLGVSGTGPGLAALPLLRHREPLSGCPCWPPAMRSDHHGHRLT